MNKSIYKIGFWSGSAAFISTIAFFIFQLLQIIGILHFPLDEIFIFGSSLCISVPFMLEMLVLHHTCPADKKFWTNAALIFSVLYVAFVTANYVVQLSTVIPMTVSGKSAQIELLRQTPHSLFWDFDAIGYIFMGLATWFAVPAFEKKGLQNWIRGFFLAHGIITPIVAFVYFYSEFSVTLLFLAVPWVITAPVSMLLLALLFKKNQD